MSIYQPNTVHGLNARAVIDAAYTHAGLTPPTNVDAISEALAKEPTPHAVAVEYATRALDTTNDPTELVDEAIAQVTRAQAVEQFRSIYEHAVDGIALERIDETRTRAVADLTPAFNQAVKELAKAAAKLDNAQPLDRDVAFNTDTTAAWKTATGILAGLSVYAIAPVNTTGNVPPALGQMLGVVSIPSVNMQQAVPVARSEAYIIDADEPEKKVRDEIRAFARDLTHDLDHALIEVARGKWEHISFAIADSAEAERRAEAAHNALTRDTTASSRGFSRASMEY